MTKIEMMQTTLVTLEKQVNGDARVEQYLSDQIQPGLVRAADRGRGQGVPFDELLRRCIRAAYALGVIHAVISNPFTKPSPQELEELAESAGRPERRTDDVETMPF